MTLISTGIQYPAFGIPALIVAVAGLVWLVRRRLEHKRLQVAAAALVQRKAVKKKELEGLATVGPTGVCGFCGALSQHVDGYGKRYYPLEWHRQDIDRIVADLA